MMPAPALQPPAAETLGKQFEAASRVNEEPAWLARARQTAMARFVETGFPTLQDEDWRFTNIAPITRLPLAPVGSAPDAVPGRPAVLEEGLLHGGRASRLVFMDGFFRADLSSVLEESGIVAASLAEVLRRDPAGLQGHLTRYVNQRDGFAALNTAFFADGAFIHLEAGVRCPWPIHLIFLQTAAEEGALSLPRIVIVAEANAQATIVESYLSLGEARTVCAPATELVAGAGATIEHCRLQDQNPQSFYVHALHAELARGANVIAHSISLGARIARNNLYVRLAGEGIDCVLNGLYLTNGEQLADHHMIVEHVEPRCNSHEYFNGILDDRSRGVFHGRILVRPPAQKTDAKQTNKNLLLSDNATTNTKPQLEIYADDVKCTHGATVGQLNDESIFYLRARGIGEETARRMLIHAFAGEIIDRVRHEGLRDELNALIWERLEQNEHIAVKAETRTA